MTMHQTTNYGIAYADADTPLGDYPAVTQAVAAALDTAMGRAGYTPPDASSFAAEVAARVALAGRVTVLEANSWTDVLASTSYSQSLPVSATFTALTGFTTGPVTIPAGRTLEVELALPSVGTLASSTVDVQLFDGTSVLDGIEYSTGAAPVFGPARLRGYIKGTGQSVTVTGRGRTNAGSGSGPCSVGVGQSGAPARFRYRIS
jgi:hypothetical protein